MTESDTCEEGLLRELYASFGLAYYHSETLHRTLCNYSVFLDVSGAINRTSSRFDEKLASAFTMTLGGIITDLRTKIPESDMRHLDDLLEKRNYLAHKFWFRHAHRMFSVSDITGLISELDSLIQIFSDATEDFQCRCMPYLEARGVTEALMLDTALAILREGRESPIPEKEEMQALEKSLKTKQKLVRVWEVPSGDDGKTVVFEMEGGVFRQFCEVGLGLTDFKAVKADWREHPAVSPYVPVEIIPRPKGVRSWFYQFCLTKGAVLWVKPGREPNSFIWGVRKSHGKDAE